MFGHVRNLTLELSVLATTFIKMKDKYLDQLHSLIDFLSDGPRDNDDIAKYIALKPLAHLQPIAIYFGTLHKDGFIERQATYGQEALTVGQWNRIPNSLDLPITRSVKEDTVIYFNWKDNFHQSYPKSSQFAPLGGKWRSLIACPNLPYGVLFGLFMTEISRNADMELFLRNVTGIFSLHLNLTAQKSFNERGNFRRSNPNSKEPMQRSELSGRQKVILKMIKKGFTNLQISQELGYSESLIKKESVKIFDVLGVSGRKEILESEI